ncbi:fenitrothion hydrolase [Solirubrobacter phytolaccae]|uniref:Fenitrothion hydrolase n=1 Tax=Solirubrobacter phytolaccae TaxID=1404360 RepID=A0A9X3SI72_9ACTN|nr:fenitrothion hydrolase [Solirubrobacter phytolaccae]MDA0183947.1 fenitrothion hydrolase [Solirubrobacter phytolaccae]
MRAGQRTVIAGGGAAAFLLAAAPAHAHGLVQRANLPIPEWLFGWAAALVLLVSFAALGVLWSKPRLEEPRWRPLPGGAALGSRAVEVVCGAVGVLLLVTAILAGYLGPDDPLSNFAPVFVLITFWVGMAFASVLLGDVFRAFNPWRAVGRALQLRGVRPYPERLGVWPAALALLGFTWFELVSGWGEHPARLATAAAVYSVLTWIGCAVYGTETWLRRGEGFSVYFNLLSRISPLEKREGVVGVRPLLGGLPPLERPPGIVGFVVVMIGTVTYDGLSQGAAWRSVGDALGGAENIPAGTIGLLLAIALIGGFYRLGMAGAQSVPGSPDTTTLARAFVHSLVPIAAVYVAAHYLSFLVIEGQAIRYTASDPFGAGWDLFGWAKDGIDYGVLSQNATWYLQVALVVAGHVAALVLAHDRALALYGEARLAVRSQYWMLGIMVGFTTLALWLLAQAGST